MANVVSLESETLSTVTEESPWKVIWKRFRKHKLAVAGMVTISLIALACYLAPLYAPYDPVRDLSRDENGQILRNDPPSLQHLMGTDNIGRDVFTRLLYAGQISLSVAFIVTIFATVIGVLIGSLSGYYGGWIDDVIQRFVEFLITIPLLPLLLAFSALLRGVTIPGLPPEWSSAVIITLILIIFGWMSAAILIRGMVLSLRNQEFTEAAKALGLGSFGIIVRHMIPNSLAPIIVSATLSLGGVIVLESALSFLGFGIQPPVPTWGNMLNEYQNEMWTQPAKVFYPGLVIFVCVLAFNYIGDGLRDAMDPRLKH
ncbi:MAG TPA: ABC transporter permease [Anaerolineales bacterium]|nr:ABC transporter permease [Anaerolineales bacterium]